jgi:alkylation response protein AidB-like acyl-CoA dehydrogenase
MRQRAATLYCEAEVLRLIRLRTLSARVRGLEPGPEASVGKTLADVHGQHVMELAKELAGAYGMCSNHGPYGEPDAKGWHYGYLYARALTIGGGTSEVQRNILGEKVLGLPREPA